ncbi:MAG: cob(I)yrinic acid a,c-diamide adenosyltransferase [Candidatus Kapaibacteriales bacterium]
MTRIYTKTGDSGETSLFNGQRVLKNDVRVEAYGSIDELNAHIGFLSTLNLPNELTDDLYNINFWLFEVGTDLATPINSNKKIKIKRLNNDSIEYLERKIDYLTEKLPELRNFILPGGTFEASQFHIARTVCRRAERRCVELSQQDVINSNILVFLNRLSDYLFVASRYINFSKGVPDVIWKND